MASSAGPVPLGSLDVPGQGAVVERGAFEASGWAIFPASSTSRVEILLGEHSLGLAQLGVPRPDVRAVHDLPAASIAGFSLSADLGAWPGADGPATVRAIATGVAGERLELHSATIRVEAAKATAAPTATIRPTAARREKGRRTLVCTHQLCLGGASRYLLETLGELLRLEAIDPVVISPIGGPLRPELEALGIPVHILGGIPLDDPTAFEDRVEEIAAWAGPLGFELALINTASPLVGAGPEVAGRLGIPAIWAIHESFPPAVLWAACGLEVRERVAAVLGEATLAVFEAASTARIFEPLLPPGRCLTLPYGLDLRPIDALRQGFDRDRVRQSLGVPADADLILCAGTIEPRKAQAVLAQAFELIAERHPAARLALAGAGDTPDSHAIAEWVASVGAGERIRLIPTTPEIQQWYGVADIVVCASRIESLPRVVLEAMAWEVPVLATEIFGLPELIEDGSTGWLCEAGDTAALADALDRALSSDPGERRRLGRAGRELVERRHDLVTYGREMAALIESAAKGELRGRGSSLATPESAG